MTNKSSVLFFIIKRFYTYYSIATIEFQKSSVSVCSSFEIFLVEIRNPPKFQLNATRLN